MSDANLIAFGCGVSFITLAGVYVYLREGFLAAERRRKRARSAARRPRRSEAASSASASA